MSTGRWLWAALWRYVLTALVGVGALAAVLTSTEEGAAGLEFALGLRVVAVGVPLLTIATMCVIVPLAGRRFEPPTGGAQRIRGGWMVLLPLVPALPLALIAPHLYVILLVTQLVYVIRVLPCQDARDTADALRSLADPAVPAADRARIARAAGELRRSRPAVESLVAASADDRPEVAEAALDTLCAIWRRDGVVGEDLLLRLPAPGRERVSALGITVRAPW